MVVGGKGVSCGLGFGSRYRGRLFLGVGQRVAGPILEHVRVAVWVSGS